MTLIIRRPANQWTTTCGTLPTTNASFCGASPLSIILSGNPPISRCVPPLRSRRFTDYLILAGASPNSDPHASVTRRLVTTISLFPGVLSTASAKRMTYRLFMLRHLVDNCSTTITVLDAQTYFLLAAIMRNPCHSKPLRGRRHFYSVNGPPCSEFSYKARR